MAQLKVCGAVLIVAMSGAVGTTAMALPQAPAENAQQQSNHPSDYEITRNIRKALVGDKTLSIGAQNVTIITKGGKVTLKGRVKSDAEKQRVEAAATSVAGSGNVMDQLTTQS